jgi:hypothetical protein
MVRATFLHWMYFVLPSDTGSLSGYTLEQSPIYWVTPIYKVCSCILLMEMISNLYTPFSDAVLIIYIQSWLGLCNFHLVIQKLDKLPLVNQDKQEVKHALLVIKCWVYSWMWWAGVVESDAEFAISLFKFRVWLWSSPKMTHPQASSCQLGQIKSKTCSAGDKVSVGFTVGCEQEVLSWMQSLPFLYSNSVSGCDQVLKWHTISWRTTVTWLKSGSKLQSFLIRRDGFIAIGCTIAASTRPL